MNKLLELVRIINRNKVKTIEVVGSLPPRKTLVQDFYEKLSSGEITNDEEAAAYFYQSDPDERNFKELKRRLTERLYNTTFFIDLNQAKYDGMRKAYYSSWRELAVAKILLGKGAYTNTKHLLKKILRTALKYNFSLLVLETTRQLRGYHSSIEFDYKQFQYYNQIHLEYTEIYHAESKAESYYGIIQNLYYGNKKKDLAEINGLAVDFLVELEPLVAKFDSYRLHLCYYYIQVNRAQVNGEIEEVIRVASKAVDYFSSEKSFSMNGLIIFSNLLSQAYWQKRDFISAEDFISRSLKYADEGSINWNTQHNLLFLIQLHSNSYQRAYEILNRIIKHKSFQGLLQYRQEIWKLYEAYMNYLICMGKVDGVTLSKYKINKFLNEVPLFSRDKQMRNIPVLVIQILFLLLYKRYDQAIDRMEAISQYCYRHLKKDETYRSNCFIRMLLKIIESDFHQAGARRRASELKQKLSNVSFDNTQTAYETEIIPYEALWELALESLENKFWKPKKRIEL